MAAKARILIVEDDENLRMALEDNLVDEGYDVLVAKNGAEARKVLLRGDLDLVVLDIMLPDTDGYTLCREIRDKDMPLRVLMLTARSLESDLVQGFDAGADDYLSKPYRLRELLARVGALLRRKLSIEPESTRIDRHQLDDITVDLKARIVRAGDGQEVKLTRTELDLLGCLLNNRGRALSREEILAQAWDPDIVVDPRTVDNFVSSIKRKLGWTKQSGYRIKTVRGVGYRMEVDDAPS
jgi:DNA-binding response OmpR family regulator